MVSWPIVVVVVALVQSPRLSYTAFIIIYCLTYAHLFNYIIFYISQDGNDRHPVTYAATTGGSAPQTG